MSTTPMWTSRHATSIWSRTRAVPGKRLLLHLSLSAGALLMLYPIAWMIASSLKAENEIFADPGLVPSYIEIQNYIEGWFSLGQPFTGFFLNSLLLCTAVVAGNLVSCSMAAYAFARLRFRASGFWFAIMLGTIMLPYHVTLIPQYTLFFNLGWVDTYLPLIVPKLLATDGFFVFLFVQFIRGIPIELEEAARVDGAGSLRIYLTIILPLLRPALVTGALFSFLWTYNDFFPQLVYISDTGLYTVPLALRTLLDTTGDSAWGPMLAMSTLSVVPMIAIFVFFQRQIVEGIATSGLKG
ncbi:carbohydrate ABC transporter permease [Saccharomonospora sp. NPDC046836]|uniref:carbohydrate ABC transporter permease n=1 Tax=Saccharomonospora sp. NPDC046836 TaxID=3156921 RepID=UPI0033E79094